MNFDAEKEVMEIMEMVKEVKKKFMCPVDGKQVIQNCLLNMTIAFIGRVGKLQL
jgi:hypothetical protein